MHVICLSPLLYATLVVSAGFSLPRLVLYCEPVLRYIVSWFFPVWSSLVAAVLLKALFAAHRAPAAARGSRGSKKIPRPDRGLDPQPLDEMCTVNSTTASPPTHCKCDTATHTGLAT